jgi:hypothetical protein
MSPQRALVLAGAGALAACTTPPPAAQKAAATPPLSATASAQAAPATYTYPPPVKGHYEEVNTGTFDLVDGIAYTAKEGTVVYVTEKPVGSPVLATASCPMTLARALTLLRNSGYLEVLLDARGRSKYLVAGTPYGGRSREEDGHWKITGGPAKGGRVSGTMAYRGYGQFDFDLPVAKPAMPEPTEGERVNGIRPAEGRRTPTEAELVAAYTEIRRAARAGDLGALLAAQGFDAREIEAIRGLPGIDADLAAHAARFLDPGTPEEMTANNQVGARGKNPKGAAFFNFYEFSPCGEKLVLVGVGENPQ